MKSVVIFYNMQDILKDDKFMKCLSDFVYGVPLHQCNFHIGDFAGINQSSPPKMGRVTFIPKILLGNTGEIIDESNRGTMWSEYLEDMPFALDRPYAPELDMIQYNDVVIAINGVNFESYITGKVNEIYPNGEGLLKFVIRGERRFLDVDTKERIEKNLGNVYADQIMIVDRFIEQSEGIIKLLALGVRNGKIDLF